MRYVGQGPPHLIEGLTKSPTGQARPTRRLTIEATFTI